jgi:hypothetical protein
MVNLYLEVEVFELFKGDPAPSGSKELVARLSGASYFLPAYHIIPTPISNPNVGLTSPYFHSPV